MNQKPNHLISEKSPYLLQHAYNPVDWFPWGEEAFKRAREEDKPIFLSIGYSTCHWCHVMARESFEDEETAALLNEDFVSVKVDREERPDIDHTYMQICQSLTGTGGWPLTTFMTHEKKPFFVGTYFPKESRWGKPGLRDVLLQISSLWKRDRAKLLEASDKITDFHLQIKPKKADILEEEAVYKTFHLLKKNFDHEFGGFGHSPKFPSPHYFTFLLRFYYRRGEEKALDIVHKSLFAMRLGGIYDHIGKGFHRYSTDRMFLVPHFEKMLYDQAKLLQIYLEAYQVMKEDLFKRTAEEIISYVTRELTAPEGAFYSAESAESEGEEGKFYTFTRKEIIDVLGTERGKTFSELFHIKEEGNYTEEATGKLTGKNILYLKKKILREDAPLVEESLSRLSNYREERIKPAKDDKIITAWNGLMVSSLATASGVFSRKSYIKLAEKAAQFIKTNLYVDHRLLRCARSGESYIKGYLDDYAFFISGLINLFKVLQKEEYLDFALMLTREMIGLFWDEKEDGFFLIGKDSEKMIFETKEIFDGASSSSNTIAAYVLLKLSRMTQDSEISQYTEKQFRFMSQLAAPNLGALTGFMSAYDDFLSPSKEIVLVKDDEGVFLTFLNKLFLPDVIYLYPNTILTWTENYQKTTKAPTVFICKDFSCKRPLHTLEELKIEFREGREEQEF